MFHQLDLVGYDKAITPFKDLDYTLPLHAAIARNSCGAMPSQSNPVERKKQDKIGRPYANRQHIPI